MSILFKLRCGDEVRRLTFSELPTWDALSSRLTALYGIPPDKLGVSYTDPDGDEITLNTQEELLDFYKTCHTGHPGQPLRLKVVDLVSLRGASTATPKVTPYTFDADDDWQRLPTLQGLSEIDLFRRFSDLDGPHNFVEVPENVQGGFQNPPESDAEHHSPASTVQPKLGKGKQRESLSFPSTASLIDEEVGDKHPIHVRDCSRDGQNLETEAKPELKEEAQTNVPTEPHPAPTAAVEENDPPLPTIDNPPTPSLTEDIATLLASLSSAVAANPELSQTLRRIVQNATTGTYWRAHRNSLHQAVNDMTQSMGAATEEFRRNAEAEAATRISNTLGNLFQSLSTPPQGQRTTEENTGPFPAVEQGPPPDSPNPPGAFPRVFGNARHHRGRRFRTSWGAMNRSDPNTAMHADTSSVNNPNNDTSHPSAPPKGPPRFSGPPPPANDEPQSSTVDRIWDPETRPPWLPVPPPIQSQVRQSAHELRAAVEAAKEQYKAEKERYRRERDERRKQKEEHRKGAANATPGVAHSSLPVSRETSQDQEEHGHSSPLARSNSHIVSHARGPYPQLEIVSVPRRSATLGGKRPEEQDVSRAVSRITRRLGDMGFTETSHPKLSNQIKSRLSESLDKPLTKDLEENVVTDLLESLLATSPQNTSPKVPIASGSGVRDNLDSVPGGWQ